LVAVADKAARIRARIVDDRHDLAPIDAAGGVDLLDGEQGALELAFLDDGGDAGPGKQHADAPRLARPGVPDHGGTHPSAAAKARAEFECNSEAGTIVKQTVAAPRSVSSFRAGILPAACRR